MTDMIGCWRERKRKLHSISRITHPTFPIPRIGQHAIVGTHGIYDPRMYVCECVCVCV